MLEERGVRGGWMVGGGVGGGWMETGRRSWMEGGW